MSRWTLGFFAIVVGGMWGCSAGASSDDADDMPADARVDALLDAAVNQPPVARAGADRTVPRNTRVVLDGSTSSDPEGAALTYRWRLVAAPAASTAALASTTLDSTELVADVPGAYDVSLVVNDGTLASAADLVRVTVSDGVPVANAGADQSVHWGQTAQLDGASSVDPDGGTLTFTWTLAQRPVGSTAALTGATTATPSLPTDRAGVYEVRLVVGDGTSTSSADVVRVTATNTPPVAQAGADALVDLGTAAALAGSGTDADGDPLTFAWTVSTAPVGSTATPTTPAQATSPFTPDRTGTYVLTLSVSDGVATATDTLTLLAHAGGSVLELDHDVVDAEYSNALDRIVMVSDDDQALHVFDPETGAEFDIALPLAPTAVSVSPSGTQAVVGHDGWMSIVNLTAGSMPTTYPVTTDAIDIVHGGNGWAYVFPAQDQWENMRCIDLATGVEQLGVGSFYAGAVGRRNPVRPSLYLADRGLSPADIELHDLTAGRSTFLRDSPYHGDYAMCGNLWFSDDGNRIFTACGNVFRSSTNAMTDMTYNGNLGGVPLIGFVDHSDQANLVAVMPANNWMQTDADVQVRLYEEQYLGFVAAVNLPPMPIGASLVPSHGRFVFWKSDGTKFYTIMRATPTMGVPRDGVWAGTAP